MEHGAKHARAVYMATGLVREVGRMRTQDKKAYLKKKNSYFSTKAYVVGTQKNRLKETVLLSTQNTCLN